jgi:hypothetical protein
MQSTSPAQRSWRSGDLAGLLPGAVAAAMLIGWLIADLTHLPIQRVLPAAAGIALLLVLLVGMAVLTIRRLWAREAPLDLTPVTGAERTGGAQVTARDVRAVRFRVTWLRRGVDQDLLDDYLDAVADTLDQLSAAGPDRQAELRGAMERATGSLTSRRFREGYQADQVTAFLARVRTTLESAGSGSGSIR